MSTGTPPGPDPGAEIPWQRLSFRVVWIDAVRLLTSLIPGYFGVVVLNDDGPVWPLVVGSALGILGALMDVKRWLKTRYRVTPTRVELRTGWLVRKDRFVPLDRIRSVDLSGKARHRIARIQVVHIGSGEARSSFQLDALSIEQAERLRRELMPDAPAGALPITSADAGAGRTGPPPAGAGDAAGAGATGPVGTAAEETVIARLRWQWVGYNIINIWAFLIVGGPLFGAYWFLRPFGFDLLGFARGLADWAAIGPFWTVVICLAVAYPVGVIGLALAFVSENWKFQLVRARTARGSALLTRRGLLNTRTVYRDDERIRGVAFREPLIWRWLNLVETKVITTGLHQTAGSEPASGILPRIRIAEARAATRMVLPDDARPMETPLVRHPRGALYRRLLWAVYGPGIAACLLAWLGATNAIPDWVWPLPLWLLPVTLIIAVAAYRSLGHALAGPYLVVRRGGLNRSTAALQRRAVIGWRLEQSIFQRWGGRMNVGVPTSAGERFYQAPDAGIDQALAFVEGATPELADEFLERSVGHAHGPRADVLSGRR